ncbi:hypothetical protein O181_097527 [Austropuccinia psidii MF-1]|uniref:Uncharacterized protein n=1 Tax=Austropuccinia psidii MF-1 TaxID=1389203 RepID=A0A9Q3PEL4_9BASI|nr:hypothetical protein [Austropuccinia psidii MF-1]
MEAKKSKASDIHVKFMNDIKDLGPSSFMAPLNFLNSTLGPIRMDEPPFPSLVGPPFYGPGLVSEVKAIWANLATIIFLGPLVTPSKLSPGGFQLPSCTTDCGM